MYRQLIVFFLSILPLGLLSQSKYEIRAVWLTTNWGLDWPKKPATTPQTIEAQQQDLCYLLDKIKELNLNTVFFQVRLRGDVIYPSQIEPWNYIAAGRSGRSPQYDPLDFAIQACHERGLECHAWIVSIPLGANSQVKAHGQNSVVARHPQWCKQLDNEWYLDPGIPEVAPYIASIATEIVSKYDVDGIHLDYIRYPDLAHRFNDRATFKKYGKKGESLQQWRCDNISRIVYTVHDEVKRIAPWVKVSSSPLGKYSSLTHYSAEGWCALETVHQDVQQWLREGKQDFVAPMIYFKDQHFFPFLYNWIKNKNDRFIVSGLGVYRLLPQEGDWDLKDVMRQITIGREMGADGQAFYRLENIIQNPKGIESALKKRQYSTPALFPPLRYLDSIPPAPAEKLQKIKEDQDVWLQWSVPEKKDIRGAVIYGSDYYPVDITNPKNIVSVVWGLDSIALVSHNQKERTYYAVTLFDYFRNESIPVSLSKLVHAQKELPDYVVRANGTLKLQLEKEYPVIKLYSPAGILLSQWQNTQNIKLPLGLNGIYWLELIDSKLERKIISIE